MRIQPIFFYGNCSRIATFRRHFRFNFFFLNHQIHTCAWCDESSTHNAHISVIHCYSLYITRFFKYREEEKTKRSISADGFRIVTGCYRILSIAVPRLLLLLLNFVAFDIVWVRKRIIRFGEQRIQIEYERPNGASSVRVVSRRMQDELSLNATRITIWTINPKLDIYVGKD